MLAAWTIATVVAAAAPQDAAKTDDHPKLPQGDGRDVMIRVCSQCHDPEWVVDQGNDEAGWKAVVDQMAGNGAQATPAEFAQIVRYFTAKFPPK
ncbi:MAG: hypothetical protein QM736_28555 [Vicinamibacterales bacterium]